MSSGQLSCRRVVVAAIATAVVVTGMIVAPPADAGLIDMYVSHSGGVKKYNALTGVQDAGFNISSGGDLIQPQGVVIGPDGLLYLTSQDNHKIHRYSRFTGVYIDTLVSGDMTYPDGLSFGPDNSGDGVPDLYVSDYSGNRVVRIPTQGAGAGTVNAFTSGGTLTSPISNTFGPDGKLYVAGRVSNNVPTYNGTTGVSEGDFIASVPLPTGITFSPDGSRFYATESIGGVIRQYDALGALLNANFATGINRPNGIAFGPDQNGDGESDLYVAALGNSAVMVFNGQTGALIDNSLVSLSGPKYVAMYDADAGKETFLSTADAEIQGRSGLANNKNGANPIGFIGRGGGGMDIMRVVMRFDLSDVAGWEADGGGRLYLYGDFGSTLNGHDVSIYEMSSDSPDNTDWVEPEVSWNVKSDPPPVAWDHAAGIDFDNPLASNVYNGEFEFAITIAEETINHWLKDLGGDVNLVLASRSAEAGGSEAWQTFRMLQYDGTQYDPRLVAGIRVPEPASLAILALGGLLLLVVRRRSTRYS